MRIRAMRAEQNTPIRMSGSSQAPGSSDRVRYPRPRPSRGPIPVRIRSLGCDHRDNRTPSLFPCQETERPKRDRCAHADAHAGIGNLLSDKGHEFFVIDGPGFGGEMKPRYIVSKTTEIYDISRYINGLTRQGSPRPAFRNEADSVCS
jgi:hypothetical protein